MARKHPPSQETEPSPAVKPAKGDDGKMTTSLRIPREMLAELKVLSVKQRLRVNDVILQAIENHIQLHGRRAA